MSQKLDCPNCGWEQEPSKDKPCEHCQLPGHFFYWPKPTNEEVATADGNRTKDIRNS